MFDYFVGLALNGSTLNYSRINETTIGNII